MLDVSVSQITAVGKSHLAITLGIKACEQGIRTRFVTATALITTFGKALAEGQARRTAYSGLPLHV